MGQLFERYVVVDWSASARPVTGPNSIWLAVLDDRSEPVLSNPNTRRVAERRLAELVAGTPRTLVAIDASFGYPVGTSAWFDLPGSDAWGAVRSHVAGRLVDDERNENDRFHVAAELNRRGGVEGPFWGRPATALIDGLATTKPRSFPVPEYRLVEQHLRSRGLRPASSWQLLGAGSVGSQTLTLLPVVHRLHRSVGAEVWPFTTGLATPHGRRPVVAETWPTAFDVDVTTRPVRDAAQVDAVARRLRTADDDGELADWFVPALDDAARSAVVGEEGWALFPPVRTGPAG